MHLTSIDVCVNVNIERRRLFQAMLEQEWNERGFSGREACFGETKKGRE